MASLRFLSEVISPSTTSFSSFLVSSNLNDRQYSALEKIRARHVFDVLLFLLLSSLLVESQDFYSVNILST